MTSDLELLRVAVDAYRTRNTERRPILERSLIGWESPSLAHLHFGDDLGVFARGIIKVGADGEIVLSLPPFDRPR